MASFVDSLKYVLERVELGFDLSNEQVECLKKVASGDNVICVLPTGFGKSLIFQLAPMLLSAMHKAPKVALVISPLLGLMANQVHEMQRLGISCVYIHNEMTADENKDVVNCSRSVYLASPEALEGRQWTRLLTTSPWKDRLGLIACDEAHCISEWGEDFRPAYKKIGVLRSLAPNGCSFVALTATATKKVINDIRNTLLLPEATHEIVRAPDRPNIHITIKTGSKLKLRLLLESTFIDLRENGYNAQKTIIYCRSLMAASDAYQMLYLGLGDAAYPSGVRQPEDKCVDLYHAEVGANATTRILGDFVQSASRVRCLVSTIAFGMGMQIPNVRKVLHWGCSKSLITYWQEIGRAGRDGLPAQAIMFANGQSLGTQRTEDDMRTLGKYITSARNAGNHICLRNSVLKNFYGCEDSNAEKLSKDCCSNCDHEMMQMEDVVEGEV